MFSLFRDWLTVWILFVSLPLSLLSLWFLHFFPSCYFHSLDCSPAFLQYPSLNFVDPVFPWVPCVLFFISERILSFSFFSWIPLTFFHFFLLFFLFLLFSFWILEFTVVFHTHKCVPKHLHILFRILIYILFLLNVFLRRKFPSVDSAWNFIFWLFLQ